MSDTIVNLSGTDQADTIRASDADEFIRGGSGNDSIRGMAGDDIISGGRGGDRLFGGSGDDILLGGRGDDALIGNRGSDTLIGGSGDDFFRGGLGDVIDGGSGADIVRIASAFADFDVSVADDLLTLTDRFSGESITLSSVETFQFRSDDSSQNLSVEEVSAVATGDGEAPTIRVAGGTQVLTVNDSDPTVSVVWDRVAQQAVIDTDETNVGPTIAARAYGMMHTAMYDAWSAFDTTAVRVSHDGFDASISFGEDNDLLDGLAEASSSDAAKQKAMSFAAYTVLSELFPDMAELFEEVMQVRYGYDVTDTTSLEARIGIDAANDLLALRSDDGSNQENNYVTEGSLSRYDDDRATNAGGPEQAGRDITLWTPEETPFDSGGPVQNFLTPQWEFVEAFGLTEDGEGNVDFLLPPAPQPFFGAEFAGSSVSIEDKQITLSLAEGAAPVVINGVSYGDGDVIDINNDTRAELLSTGVINQGFIDQAVEVVEISAGLTDEQKIIAEFWEDGGGTAFPPGTWMGFGQFVSARDGNTIDDDAKMFLALGNAVMDAGIATWHAKVEYDYARPVRVIRDLGELGLIGEEMTVDGVTGYYIQAFTPLSDPDGDGNFTSPGTGLILATEWSTFQRPGDSSPPFAEYTSGHSAFSAAGAAVLALFTGDDSFGGSTTFAPGSIQFEFGVPELETTLSWDTFTEAALEGGISRLYGGIHFDEGNVNGTTLGFLAGEQAFGLASSFWNGTATADDRPFDIFG